MEKGELIKRFNLYASPLTAVFHDGRTVVRRRLYFQRNSDTTFIFYDNDLGVFEKAKDASITDAYKRGEIYGYVRAYYSWYHNK